jgi:hypothetical protein
MLNLCRNQTAAALQSQHRFQHRLAMDFREIMQGPEHISSFF